MAAAARVLFGFIVMAAALAASPPTPSSAAGQTPAATVQQLHDTLIEVMRNAETLSVEQRFHNLEPTLNAVYDFRTMTKLVTGTAWTGASEEQRAALVDAFTRLSVATYAERFSGFSGEQFETLGVRDGPRGTTLVDTRIVRPADPAVPITYVLQPQDGTWHVIDVLVQGSISELAVRRSEYAQLLRQGGVERLTDVLTEKAADLLAG